MKVSQHGNPEFRVIFYFHGNFQWDGIDVMEYCSVLGTVSGIGDRMVKKGGGCFPELELIV